MEETGSTILDVSYKDMDFLEMIAIDVYRPDANSRLALLTFSDGEEDWYQPQDYLTDVYT